MIKLIIRGRKYKASYINEETIKKETISKTAKCEEIEFQLEKNKVTTSHIKEETIKKETFSKTAKCEEIEIQLEKNKSTTSKITSIPKEQSEIKESTEEENKHSKEHTKSSFYLSLKNYLITKNSS